ncbi:MAG: matrixin family metalloprotease [Candidatus Buchananbacteria bacterium]|nr:matrixin family metalloprotease [Candidatus Buchananbacteria bacterium]
MKTLKSFIVESFISLIIILLLFGVGYYYHDYIGRFIQDLSNRYRPCEEPIAYSLGDIDSRFNITPEKLLADIKQVEEIWESPINKELFKYSVTGDLKINLIYDYRQKATDDLKKIGLVISDDQAGYNMLKSKYDSLFASYNEQKNSLDILVANYNIAKNALERDINYWNKKGGAPKDEYDALEQRRINLNNQVATINQEKDSLNSLVDTINSTKIILNKLIVELNLQVDTYNTVGASTGKEFDEGQYVSNASGRSIDVFQFSDENKLSRVLAHEFGHALGLEHIDNAKAIMYYLNEGINEKLTTDDITALKDKCGIK